MFGLREQKSVNRMILNNQAMIMLALSDVMKKFEIEAGAGPLRRTAARIAKMLEETKEK